MHRRKAAGDDPCSEEERQRGYRDVDYTWYHSSLRSMTAQPVKREKLLGQDYRISIS
jgi:hypothetical protein